MSYDHMSLIDDCLCHEERLNQWECEFIDSIQEQIEEGRELTDNQESKLVEIWERLP